MTQESRGQTKRRISMWSGPRNISTTMMYSFRQRSDTIVFDEPIYAHYLSTVDVLHPGEEDVLASQDNDGERVVRDIMLADHGGEIVFFKNMAHHLVNLDTGFLSEIDNILLTRNPEDMLTSVIKQLPNPVLRDTGLKEQTDLLDMIIAQGQTPIVLESKEILKNPENVLRQLCTKLEIPFEASMLSWEAGPVPEDGTWAKYWYENVHKSTGFMPYKPKNESVPKELEPLLAECIPLYERLAAYAIKAE